jgi:hypothetical protein
LLSTGFLYAKQIITQRWKIKIQTPKNSSKPATPIPRFFPNETELREIHLVPANLNALKGQGGWCGLKQCDIFYIALKDR